MRTQKWPNDKHMFSSSSRTSSPTSPELWTVETELWTGLGRLRHFYVAPGSLNLVRQPKGITWEV